MAEAAGGATDFFYLAQIPSGEHSCNLIDTIVQDSDRNLRDPEEKNWVSTELKQYADGSSKPKLPFFSYLASISFFNKRRFSYDWK